MRPAVAALASMVLALSTPVVQAAEEPAKAATTISLEAVALPIVVDGRLVNYVFCSIRLDLNPKSDGAAVRAKEQFFRDDLVRAGHRTPFTRPDDYTKIDEKKVRAEVMRFAQSIVGPGTVLAATITRQVSLKQLSLPKVQQPAGREIVP